MIPAYVEAVARLAYIWGWPMVNSYNRAAAMTQLPEPGRIGGVLPGAPPGRIAMLTDYIEESERFVTCPNQDTVYGAGFQWLDKTPVIVQVPKFGDRFFTYQICDARTDAFCAVGKAARHRAGVLPVDWAQLEGSGPRRSETRLPLADRPGRGVAARLPGRHRRGQGRDPADSAADRGVSPVRVRWKDEDQGLDQGADVPGASPAGRGETKWVVRRNSSISCRKY